MMASFFPFVSTLSAILVIPEGSVRNLRRRDELSFLLELVNGLLLVPGVAELTNVTVSKRDYIMIK